LILFRYNFIFVNHTSLLVIIVSKDQFCCCSMRAAVAQWLLYPVSLGSTPVGTHMSHWWQEGHPANIAPMHQWKSGMSDPLNKGVSDLKLIRRTTLLLLFY